jgi:CDP-diglyceride synthetase
MWQRVQTIFLAITIGSLVAAIFFPIWSSADEAAGITYRLYPIYFMKKQQGQLVSTYMPFCLVATLMVAAATIALMELRRFTNRMLQVKLGVLNSFILMLIMILSVVFSNQMASTYHFPWTYDYSLYLTFVAVACNWLAIRFIKRDEKLVRDSDRIR